MSMYLLLRNNKESGPYTLDDLVTSGLKAYDLVWVEGKSAAWRYPGEIEELKPHAPMVEEQPFDRFFKKPANDRKEEPVVATASQTAPAIEEKYRAYIPQQAVAVSSPARKKVMVQLPASRQATPVMAAAAAPAATVTVRETPVVPEVKYAQPLDEIKEMYVKTLEDRKSKIARKAFLSKNLKRAAVVAGLIATGLLAGLIIRNETDDKKNLAVQQPLPVVAAAGNESLQEQQAPITTEPVQEPPAGDIPVQEALPPYQPVMREETNPPVKQKEKTIQTPATAKKDIPADGKEQKKDAGANTAAVPAKPVTENPLTGERKSVSRDNSTDEQAAGNTPPLVATQPAKNWDRVASVSSNEYKRVAFGGIRNLELTVTNKSGDVLDKVIVQLQYLKNSDTPVRTEQVEFQDIAPNGGTQTLRMPDTNRGVKVSYKIINVQQSHHATASAGF